MSQKKNSTNPNKKRNKDMPQKPDIHCPNCEAVNCFTYEKDKRRVPPAWYVTVIVIVVLIAFAFVMPWFSLAGGLAYLYYLVRPQKVLVGTCSQCGEETLFNQPDDGSSEPDFDKPWA